MLLFSIISFQANSQTKWQGTYTARDTGTNLRLTIPDLKSFKIESLEDVPTRTVVGTCKLVGDTLKLCPTKAYNAPKNAINKNRYLARFAYINGELKTDFGQLVRASAPTMWMNGFKYISQ